jgi:pimeloyl-ACP methyl ester carboxylesterase
MPTVEGAGVQLAYEESGPTHPAHPPTTLVVHGMASGVAAAGALRAALPGRVIAYDRRGYGASGAPEPYAATTVQEQGEDAAALLAALGVERARVIGLGFGALVALDLLVRRPALVEAAVLRDAPLYAFVPAANEALAAQRQLLEAALREGGPREAIARWLGPSAGQEELARAQASPRGFFADYAGLAIWSPSRRELRAIAVPVAFVTGPGAGDQHLAAAADEAAALVPGAVRRTDGDVVAAAQAL